MRVLGDRRGLTQKYLIQLLLIVVIISLFILALSSRSSSHAVVQDAVESQLALFIESAEPGMSFAVLKEGPSGVVHDVRLDSGRIFVDINGLISVGGAGYFTRYSVNVIDENDSFVVEVVA